jgi:hypothetical protein
MRSVSHSKELTIDVNISESDRNSLLLRFKTSSICEISSSHGGEYDVQSCLLGYTAV